MIPIAVINLPRSEDRRERVCAELDRFRDDVIVVDAIDGRGEGFEYGSYFPGNRRKKYFSWDLLDTEVACLMSHRKVWEMMISNDIDKCLILEDDVKLVGDLDGVLTFVERIQHSPLIVKVGGKKKRTGIKLFSVSSGHDAMLYHKSTCGGHGYILDKEAARRMLSFTSSLFLPVDNMIDRYWEHGILLLHIRPDILLQGGAASTISTIRTDMARAEKDREPIFMKVRRRLLRLWDSARRTFQFVRLFLMQNTWRRRLNAPP